MSGCAECRAYWNGLHLLTSDLDRFISVPHPSPRLAEPVWERAMPASRGIRWGVLSMAAVAACGLICGWTVWRLTWRPPPGTGSEIARNHIKTPDEDPLLAPPEGTGPSTPAFSPGPGPTIRRLPHPSQLANLRHGPRHPGRRGWRTGPRYAGTLPAMDEAAVAGSFRASGRLFETQGDPGLANVAYQAAYRAQPTEEAAYDMGRSAEESGDMDQALNAYANLLDAADVRSRAEKGLNR